MVLLNGHWVLQWYSTCGTFAGCLELDSLQCHSQSLPAIGFNFVITSVLDNQAHAFSKHFLEFFSRKLMV